MQKNMTNNSKSPQRSDRKGQKTSGKHRLHSKIYGQLLLWATKLAPRIIRLRLHGLEHIQHSILQGRSIIFAGWHGHNFLTILAYYTEVHKYCKGTIIVPDSKNGRVMAYYGSRTNLHVTTVNAALGPSQWARATITMIKQIKQGYSALLSPDGPDGPAYTIKPGITYIGLQTKAVIIPASAASTRSIKLRKRWDEHLVPLPGSRSVVHFGTPIDTMMENGQPVPAEELESLIKKALNQGAEVAEQLCRDLAVEGKGIEL